MQLISTHVARSVVYVSVLGTPVNPAKRLNRSRCRFWDKLIWAKGTVY